MPKDDENFTAAEWLYLTGVDDVSINMFDRVSDEPLPNWKHWYANIAFHCQQKAEKYIKALSAAYGIQPERKHDFKRLVKPLKKHVVFTETEKKAMADLQSYEVLPRYGGRWIPSKDSAEKAIEDMKAVAHFVNTQLEGKDLNRRPEATIVQQWKVRNTLTTLSRQNRNIANPKDEKAVAFATWFFFEINSYASDVKRISRNMGIPEYVVNSIKQYLFNESHRFENGETVKISPRFDIAQSWSRMAFFPKETKPHDRVLLQHMALEAAFVNASGNTVEQARTAANRRFNYDKQSREYYRSLKSKGMSLVN